MDKKTIFLCLQAKSSINARETVGDRLYKPAISWTPANEIPEKKGIKMLLKDFLTKEDTEKNLTRTDPSSEHTGRADQNWAISTALKNLLADGAYREYFRRKTDGARQIR